MWTSLSDEYSAEKADTFLKKERTSDILRQVFVQGTTKSFDFWKQMFNLGSLFCVLAEGTQFNIMVNVYFEIY